MLLELPVLVALAMLPACGVFRVRMVGREQQLRRGTGPVPPAPSPPLLWGESGRRRGLDFSFFLISPFILFFINKKKKKKAISILFDCVSP